MKVTIINFHGVMVTACNFEENECIPWHQHPKPHGHVVLRGRTKIEIENEDPIEMEYGNPNKELPADIKHQITALEPGTVFLHISLGNPNLDDTQCQ